MSCFLFLFLAWNCFNSCHTPIQDWYYRRTWMFSYCCVSDTSRWSKYRLFRCYTKCGMHFIFMRFALVFKLKRWGIECTSSQGVSKVTFFQPKCSLCLSLSSVFGAGSLCVVSSTIIRMVSRGFTSHEFAGRSSFGIKLANPSDTMLAWTAFSSSRLSNFYW